MVEYRGQDAGQRRFRMAGEEMAVGSEECLFYTLLLSDEALYILEDSARVYLPKVFRSRASKSSYGPPVYGIQVHHLIVRLHQPGSEHTKPMIGQ
jgi:hypothetical protein